MKYELISADSHVIEPADVWTARIEKRFLDRAVSENANGSFIAVEQFTVQGRSVNTREVPLE